MQNNEFQKFEIVNQQEKIDNECFKCFTINHDSTILIGCSTWAVIYIYSILQDGQIINTQKILDQELLLINQVYFMRSGKTFITMGYGLSFWTINENNLWYKGNIIQLEERISFLIFTKDEKKIIVSLESSLQFWKKRNQSQLWKTNFELNLQEKITSMSLNESENELIIGMQGLILLARCFNNYKWHICYKIRTACGSIWKMVIYLDKSMFVSQPSNCDNLIQYEWNKWDQKLIRKFKIRLEKNSDLSRENSISFEQDEQLLFHKFNKTLRIFSLRNRQLQLQQQITFSSCEHSFYNSRDCKFLIVRNLRGKGFSIWHR
ncbi:unnamed protein product [Paramecium sonneborni]|uniref:Uncharacterized protein n=1 Tax=Paramecium sonneborni TaxID=65129 RepID=A0A8S1RLF1_9CILI|nr:unnamed protein product [Paramecium sonneborni]